MRAALGGLALLTQLREGVAQIAQWRGEQSGHGAQRRGHAAGQLGQQDLPCGHGRESGDGGGVDGRAAHRAALDLDVAERTEGIDDALGERDLVVAAGGDRAGSLEQGRQLGTTMPGGTSKLCWSDS